VIKICPI